MTTRAMMQQQVKNTTKPVMVESDVNEQPPCKKQKLCAQNELAEALLGLRKHSIPCLRPLVRPLITSFNTDIPRIRPINVVVDDVTPISDDEEETSSIAWYKRVDLKPKSRPSSSFTLPLSRQLPLGRPLPPAPRFPRVAPGQIGLNPQN